MKTKIITLISALIGCCPNVIQAMTVEFDFDNLLSGDVGILSETALDCRPGVVCLRRTGNRLRLNKPSGVVSFPEVVNLPDPGGEGNTSLPIPYPNLGGSFSITTGNFLTPSGETATVSVSDIVDSADFVSFGIFTDSPSGYRLPSLLFIGKDENGLTVERELLLVSSVPLPAGFALFVSGMVALGVTSATRKVTKRERLKTS